MSIVYLDNAATTFPKPRAVLCENDRCIRTYCGNPGRSAHPLASKSAEKIYECRERIAGYFGSDHPENVIFTLNTTYALNMAIKGILKKGDHALISDMEHNSVFRPLEKLRAEGIITYDIFDTVRNGRAIPTSEIIESIECKLRRNTRMLICAHVPNIVSAVRPMTAIGELCRARGIVFVADCAQSAGHIPVNIEKSGIDMLCAPGHKGLFGTQGCGFLLLRDFCAMDTLLEGGSGVASLEGNMPLEPPERFEAGTLPTPAIAALSEGIGFLSDCGEGVAAHEKKLFVCLRDMLYSSFGGRVKIYLPEECGAVLLFNIDGIPSETVGRRLASKGICVRCGYHCSALGHRTLGTLDSGAVRVSFSIFNSEKDCEAVVSALKRI